VTLALSVLGWLVKTLARPFLYILYGMERQRRKQAEASLDGLREVKNERDSLRLDPDKRRKLRDRFRP